MLSIPPTEGGSVPVLYDQLYDRHHDQAYGQLDGQLAVQKKPLPPGLLVREKAEEYGPLPHPAASQPPRHRSGPHLPALPRPLPAQQPDSLERHAPRPSSAEGRPERQASRPSSAEGCPERQAPRPSSTESGPEPAAWRPDPGSLADELLGILPQLRGAQAVLTREEARLLAWMHRREAQRAFSHAGFGDMTREFLQLAPRTARERIALDRHLAGAPRLEEAFLAGEISACQVLALGPLLRRKRAAAEARGDDRADNDADNDADNNTDARATDPAVNSPDHDHFTADGGERALQWYRQQEGCSVPELRKRARAELKERAAARGEPERLMVPEEDDDEPFASIRLDVPMAVTVDWEETMELARAHLGWDTPVHQCAEVLLIEAAPEAIALTPSYQESIGDPTGDPTRDPTGDPTGDPAGRTTGEPTGDAGGDPGGWRPGDREREPERPKWQPPAVLPLLRLRPMFRSPMDLRPLPPLPGCEERARRTIRNIRQYLEDLSCLVESGEPADPFEARERLKQVLLLARPGRIFLAALLRDLRDTRFLEQLGYFDLEEFCRHELGMSDRSARNLRREAEHFRDSPELEEAFAQRRIGSQQLSRIARLAGPNPVMTGDSRKRREEKLERWIDRASRVSAREFEREVRFLERLAEASPALGWMCSEPLPQPRIEEALVRELSRHAWDHGLVERTLQKLQLDSASIAAARSHSWGPSSAPAPAGQPSSACEASSACEPSSTPDPACNRLLIRRLESLLNLLIRVSSENPLMEGGSLEETLAAEGEIHSDRRKTSAKLTDPFGDPDGEGRAIRRWGTIHFSAPRPVVEHWKAAIRMLQEGPEPMPAWAAAALIIRAAREVWETHDPNRKPKQHKVLKRDEYHCMVPGCTRRADLQAHHAHYRSLGGPDVLENKVALCAVHHAMRHAGLLRIHGTAPGDLIFEMGLRPGKPPLRTYRGDLIIDGDLG